LSFAALAAIAAVTLPRRAAIAAIAATLVMNQVVGFALLGYAHEVSTYVWGVFIGMGLFVALGAAMAVRDDALLSWRTPATLGVAFLAYQAVMFVGAWTLNGFESSTPAIVLDIAKNDVTWFALLLGAWVALNRLASRMLPIRTATA
jgi:hypothetical protein